MPVHEEGFRQCLWRIARGVALCMGLVVWGAPELSGQPVPKLTAEAAVDLGLERNARLQAAQADAAAAREAHREARAERRPSLAAQASYTRIGGDIPAGDISFPGLDTTFTILPVELNSYLAEVNVEQPIYTGGRLRDQGRAAEFEAEAAEWQAEQERVDVAFEVRSAYWNLHGAIILLETTEAAITQVEEHLRDVQSRFEAGALLMSEVLSAQTRRSEVLLERVEARNAVRTGQLELSQLIGLPLETEIVPTGEIEIEPLPPEPGDPAAPLPALDVPELNALSEQLNALQAQLGAVRGNRLPDVRFVGRYLYARPNPYTYTEVGSFRGTWEAGVVLSWSLWEAGRQSASEGQVRERINAAQARLEYAQEQSAVEATRRALDVRRATEAIEVADENVRQAEESFRVAREQFSEGLAVSAQVLDAEQAYREALTRQTRTLADYAISRAALLHAQGAAR